MSRIGKNPVAVPEGVTVDVSGQTVKAKGPKGELSVIVHEDVSVKLVEGKVKLEQRVNSLRAKKLWPTMRTLVKNIVVGVKDGYSESLEIQGVGYRCALQGNTLVLQLGFSHEVRYDIPAGIKIAVADQTKIKIEGIDKQAVGQAAAKIRSFKRPEPYKGKGIRYTGEYVHMKEGKKK
ncbi:MAG: 50S ribosomal protein L6 [Micavibrio aeruginosavorus]|uniref:Large ribosomal subunit protein uL6 n=1 Tax=Micavibrio aeruginosavorus TaxID=349221 RepID=A0A2W5PKT4_9BACT|nr:MAG: 50S ribosomal protein L6 [Micavibrio aeruginosavorus]